MEEKVYEEKQPRLALAILTAIGMGLVGCLLWGLLYYLGFIAWIAAFVVVFAAAWGYKKFNLKMDKKGYIIISVIAIVEVIITMFVTLDIAVMLAFAEDGESIGFFECFGLMMDVIATDAETQNAVIFDAVLSVVFIAVGIGSFIAMEKRKEKQSVLAEQSVNESVTESTNENDKFNVSENDYKVSDAEPADTQEVEETVDSNEEDTENN